MQQPRRVTLEGDFVRLEPLGEQHRGDLLAAASEDPSIFAFMGSSLPLQGWEAWLRDARSDAFVAWATVDRSSGRAVGSTRFGDISTRDERLEIGWTWLAPSAQRTAINSEAKLLQLGYAFDELGAGRVTLKTDGRNLRSQAAIERLGGVREGVLRRHLRMSDGFMRDTVYYSILADEWPAIRDRLRKRLARG
jgi:RimJ/RimL family protein N-acetyltransferase